MSLARLEIPQEILDSARLTPEQARLELAVTLYAQGRLGLGKARDLADMSLWEFRQLLASRRISPHYGVEELEGDLSVLKDKNLA